MSEFRKAVLSQFETWHKSGIKVRNFKIIAKYPFVEITEEDDSDSSSSSGSLSILDFKRLINTKLEGFFAKTEALKNGFIKNRKFKSVQILIELRDKRKFNLAMHNDKLLLCKKIESNDKIRLVNSLEFSLFTQNFSSNHKLLGWSIIGGNFYYVYEYLDTSLEFYLSKNELTVPECKALINSFIQGCQDHMLRSIDLNDIRLYIKSNQVIITFPLSLKISKDQSDPSAINCIRSLIAKLSQAANPHLPALPPLASSTSIESLLSQVSQLIMLCS